jgi:RNAse (barnase) inhibitor barstar
MGLLDYNSGSTRISESGYVTYQRRENPIHDTEHIKQFEAIANKIAEKNIQDTIPKLEQEAYTRAVNTLLDKLSFDVESAVRIGFDNAKTIFQDSKTQRVVATAVMAEIRKQLENTRFQI